MKHSSNKSWIWIAVFLSSLAGCAATRTQDSTGEYIDDASITTKVKSEMVADKDVSALHIDVKTTKGVVYLSGSADTRQEADEAEKIARGVAGVQSVDNNILVK